jgi:hypothetical protein
MEPLFNRFWRSAPNDVLDIQRFCGRNAGMAEKPKDEGIPYETHLDLIERELNAALKNIEEMRSKQSEAKARFQVLKTAMGAARHHLRELEDSLWPD